jgi:hypothetical protein
MACALLVLVNSELAVFKPETQHWRGIAAPLPMQAAGVAEVLCSTSHFELKRLAS